MSDLSAPLFLHEEVMLLALRDVEGTVVNSTWYSHAIGGAIMSELMMASRITVEDEKRTLVTLVNTDPIGEPIIDECIEKLATAKRQAGAQSWVSTFAGLKDLKHRVARRLCDRGILRADEDTILMLFRRKVYPEVDPKPEQEIIERMRQAIFTDTIEIDARTAILISLANSAGILSIPFRKKDLKEQKERLECIANGELVSAATKDAIQAVQAAVLMTAIMPVLMTTVITTS